MSTIPFYTFIFISRITAVVVGTLVCTSLLAGEYTPPGLYAVDYYQLPNQMRVLLKERHQARSVSYRVVVNVGQADYSCGRKETPHFLEHLLFTGTSVHTESELDDLIEGHGGGWNAYTGEEETVYELSIFSKYADLGLETLFEIITDSEITQENVDKSRDIIHRESGGRPSIFKQWSNKLGLGKAGSDFAHDKLLEGTPYVCQGLEMADDISRSDILEAYSRYYVPNNMTLIVVGDFDSTEMKTNIELSFGGMKAGEDYQRETHYPKPNAEALLLTSVLSPIVDNDALVGLAYSSGGMQLPDFYAGWFIERYLADRLYDKLRVEEGLSYSPSILTVRYRNAEIWYAYADTELSDMDEVVDMIQSEIEQLVLQPVSEEQMTLVKNKLLMLIVQGYESNAGMADYYTGSLYELETYGALIKEEEEINGLSADAVQRVAKEIFEKAPPIVFFNKPTITYKQLAAMLGFFALVLVYFLIRRVVQFRAK